MTSGIARGHIRTTTKTATESRKIAAIFQLIALSPAEAQQLITLGLGVRVGNNEKREGPLFSFSFSFLARFRSPSPPPQARGLGLGLAKSTNQALLKTLRKLY